MSFSKDTCKESAGYSHHQVSGAAHKVDLLVVLWLYPNIAAGIRQMWQQLGYQKANRKKNKTRIIIDIVGNMLFFFFLYQTLGRWAFNLRWISSQL